MRIIIRTSDKGNPKEKLEFADKFYCIQNAIDHFKNAEILIIADNCSDDTIGKLKEFDLKIIETNLGNSKSFLFAIQYAIDHFDNNDIVYLLEDDYIHLQGSFKAIKEGVEIADYVTLYNHPDKYVSGVNPFVRNNGEISKVFLTRSSYWKTTNSTTMTFALKLKTIKRDYLIWKMACMSKIPKDFYAFIFLTKILKVIGMNRTLICPIPGYSTHAETGYLSALIKWEEI